jgi:isopentenyldiphosphate isomerase
MNHLHAARLAPLVQKRLDALVPRIQHLPPAGSRPLTVAGRVAGWATSRAAGALRNQPGIRVDHEAVHVVADTFQKMGLNAVMAQAARVLNDAGCVRSWRNELLDVYAEGRRLAVIERGAVRPLGLLTKAVHLNAWSPDGRLWVARRSLTKSTDPGLWDTLVGGLAGAGEALETSLLRESNEEAGLEPEHLHGRSELRTILRMHRRLPEGYQVEDILVSDCVLADDIQPRNLDGEVSEIRLVSLADLWSMIEQNLLTLEAELVVLEGLQRRIQLGIL